MIIVLRGGRGKEGVRNDNGGICTAEMEKKVFLFLSSRNSDSLLTKCTV